MIRINLLPQKKEARRGRGGGGEVGEGSNLWLAVVGGLVLLEAVGLLFWYKSKQNTLADAMKANQEVEANIGSIKAQIANHDEIKAQLKDLRDREAAIQKLQAARTGPTSTLLELSHVLTPGRGPTVDRDKLEQLKRDNPGAVPNPNWDPRRLWLTGYNEADRTVRLQGLARDGEDVSEFLRRLSLSDYYYELKLLPASKTIDDKTHLELVKFELSAKARY
jgi:type IV pilus assembly protein PilN